MKNEHWLILRTLSVIASAACWIGLKIVLTCHVFSAGARVSQACGVIG